MTWHADEQTWATYTAGVLPHSAAAALEAHVTGCSTCQATARDMVEDPAPLWRAVRSQVVSPRPPLALRILRRLGLSEEDLVILRATGDLRLPWAVAIGGALVCIVLTGTLLPQHQDVGFLLVGPLVPALAVVAAFEATDPLSELSGTLPYSRLRLALLRMLATLVVAVPSMAALSALVPGLEPLLWTWLLPCLGLTGLALLLLDRLRARSTAVTVAVVWVTVVTIAASAGTVAIIVGLVGQLACLLLAVVCAGLLVRSTHTPHYSGGLS